MNAELLEALKTAYKAEVEGCRAYLKYAKQTNVASGKDMFTQLALDEIDHMELIQDFIDKTMQGLVYDKVEVPAGRLSGFMPSTQDISKLKKTSEAAVGDSDALKVALMHEEKARDFYKAEAEKADIQEVKDLFNKLAEVEQRHYDILQAEIDFINEDGFWFDTMEFSLEIG